MQDQSNKETPLPKEQAPLLLQLDTSKAGMAAVKKEDVERIINETSAGSPFYANEERKRQIRAARNAELVSKLAPLRPLLEKKGRGEPLSEEKKASTSAARRQATLTGFVKTVPVQTAKGSATKSKKVEQWPTDPVKQVALIVDQCDLKEKEFVLSVAEFEVKKIRGGWKRLSEIDPSNTLRKKNPSSSSADVNNSGVTSDLQVFLPTFTVKVPKFFGIFAHIDMDAFFAAVEEKDNPALKGIPFAVGGMSMLSTSNYEARKYGVRAAMPGYIAKKLCPQLKIVHGSYERYQEESQIFKSIIADYDPKFSSGGIDEAGLNLLPYLLRKRQLQLSEEISHEHIFLEKSNRVKLEDKGDYSDEAPLLSNIEDDNPSVIQSPSVNQDSVHSPEERSEPMSTNTHYEIDVLAELPLFLNMAGEVLHEMRARIFQSTQLTASAGVAYTRCLAKIMSNKNKPNGQYIESVPQLEFDWIRDGTQGKETSENELKMYMHRRHLSWATGLVENNKNKQQNDTLATPFHNTTVGPVCLIALRLISYLATHVVGPLKPRDIPSIGKASEEFLVALGIHTCTDLFTLRYVLYHGLTPKTFEHILTIAVGCMGSWSGGLGTSNGDVAQGNDGEDDSLSSGNESEEDKVHLGQKRRRDEKDNINWKDEESGEPTALDRKSLSNDRTFSQCRDASELVSQARRVCNVAADRLLEEGLTCRHITLKLKGTNYHVHQYSEALPLYIVKEDSERPELPVAEQTPATSTWAQEMAVMSATPFMGPVGIRRTINEVVLRLLVPHLDHFADYRLLGVRCGNLLLATEAVEQNAYLLAAGHQENNNSATGKSPVKGAKAASSGLSITDLLQKQKDGKKTSTSKSTPTSTKGRQSVCSVSDDEDEVNGEQIVSKPVPVVLSTQPPKSPKSKSKSPKRVQKGTKSSKMDVVVID